MNRTVWHYMQVSRSSLSQCRFNEPCKCKIINLDHQLNPLKSHFNFIWSRHQRHQIGDHPTSCTSRRNVSPLGPTTTMPWRSVLLPPTAYFWRNADRTCLVLQSCAEPVARIRRWLTWEWKLPLNKIGHMRREIQYVAHLLDSSLHSALESQRGYNLR